MPQALKFFRLFVKDDESKAIIENQKLEFIAAIHGCKIEKKKKENADMTEDEKIDFMYGKHADWVRKNIKRSK